MDSQEIIKELKANASEKYRENVIRMGIPAGNCIGVATPWQMPRVCLKNHSRCQRFLLFK